MITKELLQESADFVAADARVLARLERCNTDEKLMRFLIQYASWNGVFANGVVALTSLIGGRKAMFLEASQPLQVADRSNLVASYIFDAARDEYDDGTAAGHDPHRSLAQAMLIAVAKELNQEALLHEHDPEWLDDLNSAVADGYEGDRYLGRAEEHHVFRGIGYHLGSEVLADREFSIIDTYLRTHHNDLVQKLMRTKVEVGGETHRAYAWIGIHSGHGGGVEEQHFEAALTGVNLALKYNVKGAGAEGFVIDGFQNFERDHLTFFTEGEM